ncbi:MAG: HNH endonuclease [Saprospiraceae bacterium]
MKDLRIFRKEATELTEEVLKSHLRFHSCDNDDTTSALEKRNALKALILQFQEEGKDFDAEYSLIQKPELLAALPANTSKYKNHWSQLKPTFVEVISKYCPVCSAKSSRYDGDVDHYRPKSLYKWLTYESSNYVLLCSDCNRAYKRTRFPIFGSQKATQVTDNLEDEQPLTFNPFIDNPTNYFKLLLFEKGGSVTTNNMRFKLVPQSADKVSYEYQKVIETVDTFNLDNSRIDKNNYSDRVPLSRRVYNSLENLARKKKNYEQNKNPQNLKQYLNQIRITKENHGGSWLQFILEGQFEVL